MRARATFDTLAYANKLKAAGLAAPVAEAQAEAAADMVAGLLDDTLATKQDIQEVRTGLRQDIAEVRTELKQDIAELRIEVKQDIGLLRSEMRELETRMTLRMGTLFVGTASIMTAILSILHLVH